MKTSTIIWIASGVTVLGSGVAAYFLFFRKKENEDDLLLGGLPSSSKSANSSSIGSGRSVASPSTAASKLVREPNWNDPFDMTLSEKAKAYLGKSIVELPESKAKQLAKQIHEAKASSWFLPDDTKAISAVFTALKSKVEVSNLSAAFWNTYKKDMWQYLKSFLSDSELEQYVNRPAKSKTNYQLA